MDVSKCHFSSMLLPSVARAVLERWRLLSGDTFRDRLQLRLLLATGIAAIVLLLLIGRNTRDASDLLTGQARQLLTGQSQALVINLRESLNLADYTARQVRRDWLQNRSLRTHDDYVNDLPNFRPLILQIAVIGPDGWLRASSLPLGPEPVYLGDREHFKVHLDGAADRVFISQQLIGRVSGKASIQFTRPIRQPDGQFAGVVVLSLDADFLRQLVFDPVLTQGEPALLLDDRHRVVLAHRGGVPTGSADLPQPPQTGEATPHNWHQSSIDGYPLRLAVGTSGEGTRQQLQRIRVFGWALAIVLLLGLLIYLRNVTGLVRQRNQLMQAQEASRIRAERASQMKSRFVSNVSHELRTPLNGVLGFAQLVEMADSLDEARRHARIIHTSAKHLHYLVNTILDLAKIEAGQLDVQPESVNLRNLVDPVFQLHRTMAEQKGLRAEVSYHEALPPAICTDPTRLTQILNNLLHNAVKFTPSGRILLQVFHDQGVWNFTVHDTGIGMDADQIAQLSQRFSNIHIEQPELRTQQGAGLGMALTQELVTLLRGRVQVISVKGRGTAVRVALPDLASAPPATQDGIAPLPPTATGPATFPS